MSLHVSHSLSCVGNLYILMKGLKFDLYASNQGGACNSLVPDKNIGENHLTQNCQFKA
jgi:hypothetical protein